jgi:hypothetical protein
MHLNLLNNSIALGKDPLFVLMGEYPLFAPLLF